MRVQYDFDKKLLSTAPGLHCSIPSSQLPSAVLQASTKGQLAAPTDAKTDPYCFPGVPECDLHALLDCELLPISIGQKEHTCFTATSSLPFWTTWDNLTKQFFIRFSCDSFPILLTLWKGMFWLCLLLHALQFLDNFLEAFRLRHPTTAALRLWLLKGINAHGYSG